MFINSNNLSLKTIPILKVVLLFIVGLIIGNHFSLPINYLLIIIILFTILSIILILTNNNLINLKNSILCLVIILAGILHYQITSELFPKNHIQNFTGLNDEVTISGYVASTPLQFNNEIKFILKTKTIKTTPNNYFNTTGKILIKSIALDKKINIGDYLILNENLIKPAGERNPGEFNYQKYLKSKHIFGIVYIKKHANIEIISTATSKWHILHFISYLRIQINESIDKVFLDQNRALLKGLILGERNEISSETKTAFSNSGVMHVLAVSGLHIGFVVIFFSLLFTLLRLPYRLKIILLMISLALYAAIVGFKAPVVRASLVVELYLFGKYLQRQLYPLNLLAAAALIILTINPLELFQASFQLSFMAVISIFYIYKILQKLFIKNKFYQKVVGLKIGNYICQLFLISVAVSCGTLPLTIYYFEKLPLLGIFINIIAVPLTGCVIILGFMFIIISPIFWPLANLIYYVNDFLITLLIKLISTTNGFHFTYLPIYGTTILQILLIYLCLFLILNIHKQRYRKVIIYITFILLNIYTWKPILYPQNWLEIVFFDVGQGDSALLKFPDKKYILIDGGLFRDNFSAGERYILPYLKREKIKKLDAIILSHADSDHLGGLPYILHNIPVKQIIDNNKEAESNIYHEYKSFIDSSQIVYNPVKTGSRIHGFDNCGIFIFHPDNVAKYRSHNNDSVVLKLIYGNVTFLFTGDIENEIEQKLLEFGKLLKSDLIKIPHHGSKTSSSEDFIKLIDPQYAVISVGRHNRFNHPAPSVISRLNSLEINTIRTDINGAIIFRTDGRYLKRVL